MHARPQNRHVADKEDIFFPMQVATMVFRFEPFKESIKGEVKGF